MNQTSFGVVGGMLVIFCYYLALGLPISVFKSLVHHQVNFVDDVIVDPVHRWWTVDGKLRNRNRLYRTQFGRDSAISIGSSSTNIRVVVYLYRMWAHFRGSFIVDLGLGTCWDRGIGFCAARDSLFMAN